MIFDTSLTLLEASNYIKAFGMGYVSGTYFLSLDIRQANRKPKSNNDRFAKTIAANDRRNFGWGAENYRIYGEANTDTKSKMRIAIILLAIFFGAFVVLNALNNPMANIALGLVSLLAGLSTRRRLRRFQNASLLEFDYTTLAFGLLFVGTMT